ncbi:MAG: bifunctional homocysteine S-methyltransferase/methylenetetrahydrofolate reductase, partial [Longimicrobiales bacterium]
MTDLTELLADGRVHVMDGAMGTMLYARGVFVNVCYDELNLSRPQLIADVHEQYIRAGAELIETNTFGANPVKLASYGLEERTEEINAEAAAIAVGAAAGRAAVLGAVGPLGVRVEPLGPTGLDEAKGYFRRQVKGLIEGGVHGFLLETFADLSELEQALLAVREQSDLPILAQITVGEDCVTSYGASVEQAAAKATEWGADAVGLNCSVGPAVVLDGLERMVEATPLPLTAQPNAGLPRAVGDRKMYLAGPEYMAQYARRLIQAGARFVGGCCGTTPDHIRRIREEVATLQPRTPAARILRTVETKAESPSGTPLRDRSRLGRKLALGEWLTAVQIQPPRGWDDKELVSDCRNLANAGVDLVTLYEDRRTSRMGVLAAARLVLQRCAIEPVVHYTCQSRTMFDMISDLLGASASDLRNLLLVSGDPPLGGPYPEFAPVLDIDSIGLTNVVAGLNAGVDPSGNSIGAPTQFVTGVALNQGARDRAKEVERLYWKAAAGADYAVTQPVFDADQLFEFLSGLDT